MSSLVKKAGTALRILRNQGASALLDNIFRRASDHSGDRSLLIRMVGVVTDRLTRNQDPYRVRFANLVNCPHCHGLLEKTAEGKQCRTCRDFFV